MPCPLRWLPAGVLGVIAGEWDTLRRHTMLAMGTLQGGGGGGGGAKLLASLCRLLRDALLHCEGSARELIEAAAPLCLELLRSGGAGGGGGGRAGGGGAVGIAGPAGGGAGAGAGASRPVPCVLEPLAAALSRCAVATAPTPSAATAAPTPASPASPASATASRVPVDALLESGLVAWTEAALSMVMPSLTAGPSAAVGDGTDAAPVDLTDDDDEALAATCDVLSACVLSAVPRLVDLACAAAPGLLCGPDSPMSRATGERPASRPPPLPHTSSPQGPRRCSGCCTLKGEGPPWPLRC